ncbi:hypothetical protein NCCP2222_20540 [Sporosarcina sp. NCCP-2222]|uniref:EutP/PduV family microcompartment system protein n=1 Tax=Sporosarcina sp. NCCP-2222 TaxID=2935073 RepID=UPI00208ACDFF|nr:EutP/PduV family microcompartment system protein [Sporosarcina sp. NCCP-2222]GKV56107.1 hypothetical protein NCCP2222_20540 [Sporosarcina sp. NCCP-2222]
MQNKAMLIGAIGAGKSTLTNALLGKQVPAVKTQTLIYYDWIVDTPGEYTENPLFYKNIMATALEVSHVFYLQDATNGKTIFPPGFSMGVPKIGVGVITKCDHPEADVERAFRMMKDIISEGPVIITSSVTGDGIAHLKELVKCTDMRSMKEYVQKTEDDHVRFIGTLYTA